jgi:DNA-directed RNA polymerase specialized sigma24 family protein
MVSGKSSLQARELARLRSHLEQPGIDPGPVRCAWWIRARRFLASGRASQEASDAPASCLEAGAALGLDGLRGEELLRSLEGLAFTDRRVLELAYVHQATVLEIASEFGIECPEVRSRLVLARERLRRRLDRRA